MFLKLVIKKYLFPGLLFFFLQQGGAVFAQDATDASDEPTDRYFYTGGNIGLAIGTVDYAEIAPLLGYAMTDIFAFGVGI